jgi:hypothetical protein
MDFNFKCKIIEFDLSEESEEDIEETDFEGED